MNELLQISRLILDAPNEIEKFDEQINNVEIERSALIGIKSTVERVSELKSLTLPKLRDESNRLCDELDSVRVERDECKRQLDTYRRDEQQIDSMRSDAALIDRELADIADCETNMRKFEMPTTISYRSPIIIDQEKKAAEVCDDKNTYFHFADEISFRRR